MQPWECSCTHQSEPQSRQTKNFDLDNLRLDFSQQMPYQSFADVTAHNGPLELGNSLIHSPSQLRLCGLALPASELIKYFKSVPKSSVLLHGKGFAWTFGKKVRNRVKILG